MTEGLTKFAEKTGFGLLTQGDAGALSEVTAGSPAAVAEEAVGEEAAAMVVGVGLGTTAASLTGLAVPHRKDIGTKTERVTKSATLDGFAGNIVSELPLPKFFGAMGLVMACMVDSLG